MIVEMERFKELFTRSFEIDDEQAIDLVIATAVSHKICEGEMLWLRIIGASGTGKTELLRTLAAQKDFCVDLESLTPGAIRRGYVFRQKKENQRPLLERLNGRLVITKEFAIMLTKDIDAQKEIYGLLRGVHDGYLDADYGSEEGHIHQESRFDWILGTTQFVDRQRQLDTLLGSRFIDLRWGSPINRNGAVDKATYNDGSLGKIRGQLASAMTNIIDAVKATDKVELSYLSELANISASMRTPVERDSRSKEIIQLPDVELGTRMGQALSRMSRGLIAIGVEKRELRPYLIRVVFDCMDRMRAGVIRAWIDGLERQNEIAGRIKITQGFVSRIIEDINVLGFQDNWLEALNGRTR